MTDTAPFLNPVDPHYDEKQNEAAYAAFFQSSLVEEKQSKPPKLEKKDLQKIWKEDKSETKRNFIAVITTQLNEYGITYAILRCASNNLEICGVFESSPCIDAFRKQMEEAYGGNSSNKTFLQIATEECEKTVNKYKTSHGESSREVEVVTKKLEQFRSLQQQNPASLRHW
jgi:hypothetical protein